MRSNRFTTKSEIAVSFFIRASSRSSRPSAWDVSAPSAPRKCATRSMRCATVCARSDSAWESPRQTSNRSLRPPGRYKAQRLGRAAVYEGHAQFERGAAQRVEPAINGRIRIDAALAQQKITNDEARICGDDIGPAIVTDKRGGLGKRKPALLDR